MKYLFWAFMLLLPLASLSAQNNDDIDEKLYLAGAVPEKDGKVVFSREFSIPGMSEEDIFNRMQKWMESRLKENGNEASRITYANSKVVCLQALANNGYCFVHLPFR